MVSKLVGAATTCCNLCELFFDSFHVEPPSVDLKIDRLQKFMLDPQSNIVMYAISY